MAAPLSPTTSGTLNQSTTPSTTVRYDTYDVQAYTAESVDTSAEIIGVDGDGDSSPFVSTINIKDEDQENLSPSKSRQSRVISGPDLSPLKILQTRATSGESIPKEPQEAMPPPSSPRKTSSPGRRFPERRFPVKVSQPDDTPRAKPQHGRQLSLEDAIRDNEGLKKAIEIFEDDGSVLVTNSAEDDDGDTISFEADKGEPDRDEAAGPDDTMVSTFSTFSAVPDMTMFARLDQTPTLTRQFTGRLGTDADGRPSMDMPSARGEPSPSRGTRSSLFPGQRRQIRESGNTTNLLMDFTDSLRYPVTRNDSPSRSGRISPSKTMPNTADVSKTPRRQSVVNLLDFDLPPMPTPRSVPTITPRELESLKSNFLSEISSLKASLSGKEAEVMSLKTAVGDAEKRVGECMEQLREERSVREQLAAEKESWEKRGRDMEGVLRKVKEEIVISQREREELEAKLDEAEKRREAAEMMAQEAESKMAGMRAGKTSASDPADKCASPGGGAKSPLSPRSTNQQVELAVERVARELHALYKSKHETKVAALKKSYENRWEKKVRELEGKLEDLAQENEHLRLGRDATMTRVDPNASVIDQERKDQAVKNSAQIKELEAEIEKLEAVVKTVQLDNGELRQLLERERVEKGELVMLAEEMMSMQQSFVAASTDEISRPATADATATIGSSSSRGIPASKTQPNMESFRSSEIGSGRPSGLKKMAGPTGVPGGGHHAAESRIGRVGGPQDHGKRGGVPRPGSGLGMRSGLMSSIEKMGSYRSRAE